MKINFKGKNEAKKLYQVGNVVRDISDTLYLVVGNSEDGYELVNLTDNTTTCKYVTLEDLASEYADRNDVLVHVEINEI